MPTECLEGYVHMLEILVIKYGKLTNFGHMCEDLGINIIAANTPQANGKVEKRNNTI